jgi:hypothetical protein
MSEIRTDSYFDVDASIYLKTLKPVTIGHENKLFTSLTSEDQLINASRPIRMVLNYILFVKNTLRARGRKIYNNTILDTFRKFFRWCREASH